LKPPLGGALFSRIEIPHFPAEHRLRRKGQPFVPGAVAKDGDAREAAPVLEVEADVAEQSARLLNIH
jgi:hypothetical protein